MSFLSTNLQSTESSNYRGLGLKISTQRSALGFGRQLKDVFTLPPLPVIEFYNAKQLIAHWSKSKSAHIYTDLNCNRCHSGPASLAYMFWTCPLLFQYWKSIFVSLSVITSVAILPSPLVGLFGVLPPDQAVPIHLVGFIAFLSLTARRAILMQWNSPPLNLSHIMD